MYRKTRKQRINGLDFKVLIFFFNFPQFSKKPEGCNILAIDRPDKTNPNRIKNSNEFWTTVRRFKSSNPNVNAITTE